MFRGAHEQKSVFIRLFLARLRDFNLVAVARILLASVSLYNYLDWPYVAQVSRLERTVWYRGYPGKTRAHARRHFSARPDMTLHLILETKKVKTLEADPYLIARNALFK